MTLTKETVSGVIDTMFRRCEAAKKSGGIPYRDYIDGRIELPRGWWLDPQTQYFLPPNVRIL